MARVLEQRISVFEKGLFVRLKREQKLAMSACDFAMLNFLQPQ